MNAPATPGTLGPHKMEAEVVAGLAKQGLRPKLVELKTPGEYEGAVLAVPPGVTLTSVKKFLDEYLDAPERRRGTAALEDLDSFVAHTTRFADEHSVVFARRDPPSLLSVLDYHENTAEGSPRFGQHRSAYTFPLSKEWLAWREQEGSKKAFAQASFAEFIEGRLGDIIDPAKLTDAAKERLDKIGGVAAPPWKLLQLSRGLALKVNAVVKNVQNLSTGETQIQFETTHEDPTGKVLDVPNAFVIGIPVFQRGALYEIPVRLRYRHIDGKVLYFYDLLNADAVLDDAFQGAVDVVKAKTGLPVLFGAPEA